jgi:hypothetical protein
MPEEVPEHHAGQREHQPHHQTNSVDNHKSSLIGCCSDLKTNPAATQAERRT